MKGSIASVSLACTAMLICLGGLAAAQGPSPAGQPQHAQANPLPLSGRGGQSGSVTAVEAPIAGTTNSVTTINPSVQVQGPYAGSSSSTAKLPFSGKLSLRDAIERGLSSTWAVARLDLAVRQAEGQSQVVRSALLPNVSGYLAETLAAGQPRRLLKGCASTCPSPASPSQPSSGRITTLTCAAASPSPSTIPAPGTTIARPRRCPLGAVLRKGCARRAALAVCGAYPAGHRNPAARRLRARPVGHGNGALQPDPAGADGRRRRPDRCRPQRSRAAARSSSGSNRWKPSWARRRSPWRA